MPSFGAVLDHIGKLWQENREQLLNYGSQIAKRVSLSPRPSGDSEELDPHHLDQAVELLFNTYDWSFGGWGPAPKFPQAKAIELLLRQHKRLDDKLALNMANNALYSMARGGLYDLIGGGFHRYSVDEQWLIPHFEKMLYDNALLARLYLLAWQTTGDPFYRQIVEQTLSFLKREMLDPAGGFYASLDADSEGEEGKYYLWSREEITASLGDEFPLDLIFSAYGISENGNFEGRNIPFRALSTELLAEQYDLIPEEVERILQKVNKELLRLREKRVRPARDDKVLTAWNGLMLDTLSLSARVLNREKDLRLAQQCADFLLHAMIPDGKLKRSWRQGKVRYNAYLQDHAALGLGLLSLYQADFNPRWFLAAVDQAEQILAHFGDPQGGFFDTRHDHEKLIGRPRTIQDTPMPSGNSMAVSLLLRLGSLSGDSKFTDPAETSLKAMQTLASQHPAAFAGWLCQLDFATGNPLQLAIVGDSQSDNFIRLARTANEVFLPNMVIAGGPPDNPDNPYLLAGRNMIENRATAYLCQGFSCKLPTNSPQVLSDQIGAALKSSPG
jgi:uncharacterized protein YyaL (SSP411 family)